MFLNILDGMDLPKVTRYLSPISGATLEGCGILRRRSFGGESGLLGAGLEVLQPSPIPVQSLLPVPADTLSQS